MFSILKKQQRQLLNSAMQALSGTNVAAAQQPDKIMRVFSTTKAEPKAEELAKSREEWGEKYSDECFKFEKEWKIISEKIEKE